ncbi:MAG: ATP-dependent helicase [Candidatus Methanoculleus thermohydrogenotrophicum]|nr:ATP-dependent helicase [Candidatus Methanoculleus thermohydrogenotrophicum]
MSADLIRWTGGPGSGKTHQLLEMVRGEVEDGRTLDDMILMTFSRSQAADLADRLARSVFPDEDRKDILRRCATVDGMTLRAVRAAGLISDSPDQIIVPTGEGAKKAIPVYREFMQAHGIPYTPGVYAPDDGDPVARAKLPAGNQILEINAYLSATMRPAEDWQYAAAALGLPFNGAAWGITDLLPAWQEFKAAKGVFEHADYVRLAVTDQVEPQAPIIFIDEYQDMSPLQDALVRQWIDQADRVYVAGDPDQSIYGFRGCRPDLFLSLPAEDRGAHNGNRPISRRCAMRIMAAAERILGRPANVAPNSRPGRYGREVYSHNPGALASRIEDALQAYPGGPVFVLSRFRKHVSKIARTLAAMGIPCTGIRSGAGGPWGSVRIGRHKDTLERETVNVWRLTRAVRRYATGGDIAPMPYEEVEALILATLPPARRQLALTDLKAKIRRTPRSGWETLPGGSPPPGDRRILTLLNLRPALVEQIQACISREDRRGTVIGPEAVRVDTIHASKGLEAPAVLLHTGYLSGLVTGLADPERMAEERRVYFVGATRASHALILFDYIAPPWPGFGRPT